MTPATRAQATLVTLYNGWIRCRNCGGDRWITLLHPSRASVIYCQDCMRSGVLSHFRGRLVWIPTYGRHPSLDGQFPGFDAAYVRVGRLP